MPEKKENKSNEIVENLVDLTQPFNPQYLHFFSDITSSDLASVKEVWDTVDQTRKLNLLRDLEKLMEVDTLASCDDFGFFALEDEDPLVKSQAIQLLWESADIKLASRYLNLVIDDQNPELSESAAAGLGKFVLLGELEEIPEENAKEIMHVLIEKYLTSKNIKLRQRILESLGYANNPQISGFITNAIKQPQKEWVLSALFAINRSANEDWSKVVLNKLSDLDPDIQLEAIKAAGELEIAAAKEIIFEVLENTDPEEEMHLQAIWSLSMIGGNDVRKILDRILETTESVEEEEMLDLAMDNLELTTSFDSLDLFKDED